MNKLILAITLSLPLAASTAIVNHTNVDQVASLPQSTMDAIGRQRWLFTHASVGANMIDGMQTLHSEDTNRFRLVMATYGDGNSIAPPPASTVPGTIYDAPRGNPGWQAKFTMFDQAVRNLGWRSPAVSIAMDKLCYIDQNANPTNYVTMMTALAQDFPDTVFVYTTMPLESSANSDNMLRTDYNNHVRAHCQAGNRVLFDIADIEAHDPSGNAITFTNTGKVYQRLYSGYTGDGGHLNTLGQQRVALGWYATAAALTDRLQTLRLVPIQNAQIDSDAPNTPFEDWGVIDANSTRRILLQFDLAAIPPGAAITSAKLGLVSRAPYNYAYNVTHAAWRVENDAWNQSTVTWNNFVSGPTDLLAVVGPAVGHHYVVWDLNLSASNLMTDLADDRFSVLGIDDPGMNYYSRAVPNPNNLSGQPDADIVPYLEITYTGTPPVIPPPQLRVLAHTNDQTTLAWNTFPGWRYQLQTSTALETTNWTAVTGTNYAGELSMTNSVALGTNQQQFFRVQQFAR